MSIRDLMNTPAEIRPSFISSQVTEAQRYHFDLNPKAAADTVIVCGGCERLRADYVIDRQEFPFYVIECVTGGAGTLQLAGGSYQLAPGMAYAYGPGVAHLIRSDPARSMLKYYIAFAGTVAEQLLFKSVLGTWRVVQLSSPHEVADLFELLQREGSTGGRCGAEICGALLRVLVMKINQNAVTYGSVDLRAFETFQRAKRVMQQRFLTLRSAEEAALACHMDRSYLSRLFQRFATTTPYKFITRLKINRAAELLLDQQMLVKEVADELGFANAFHFSRTFKRVYGVSPERFVRHRRVGGG